MKKLLCGIDEAGRGALAGPLVAAAVILPCSIAEIAKRARIKTVKDGKLLKPKHRTAVYKAVRAVKATIAIQVVNTQEINTKGIGWANKEAMRQLVELMDAEHYILDGKLKIESQKRNVQSMVDADATVAEVMIAGIIAKVVRDKLMRKLHKSHPQYRWWTNKGYGTKDHIEALRTYGAVLHHRTLFVSTALKQQKIVHRK